MDRETIERLDVLRAELHGIQAQLRWLDEWSGNLYPERPGDVFFVTVERKGSAKCVFRGVLKFDEVDRMHQKELSRLTAMQDDIQRQIDEL